MRLDIAARCSQLQVASLSRNALAAGMLSHMQLVKGHRLQPCTDRRRRCTSVACGEDMHSRAHKPPRPGKPTNIADLEGSPFYELGLKEIQDGMGRTRVRQHVNPLASQFQQPTAAPEWSKIYKNPQLPLFVDMGCGPGRFLLLLCKRHQQLQQSMNYLGLEIRQPLVERANKWAAELSIDDQVYYLFTNVSISLSGLLQDYPGPIATLAAQFPDPLFKKRHRKRRMVQQSVVQAARELLMPGGRIFLQSDIYAAVEAMRDEFEQHAGDVLQLSPLHSSPSAVYHWTPQQEAEAQLAAAASKEASKAVLKQQQRLASMQRYQQGDHSGVDQEDHQHSVSSSPQQSPEPLTAGAGGEEQYQAVPSQEADDVTVSDSSSVSSIGPYDGDGVVSSWAEGGWLVDNPLGVPTEREHYVQAQGGKVFRVLLVKK